MNYDPQRIIDEILDREGLVFTDDPRDPGGATFGGLTLRTARRYYGAQFSVEQLKSLTRSDLEAVYLRMFILDPNFHRIEHARLRFICIDFGVHSSPRRAIESLQTALASDANTFDITIDGVLGPQTLKAVNEHPAIETLANTLAVSRALFCARLVQNDVNAFVKLFERMKREQPALVRRYFPTPKDELDVAAFNHGWIRRALSDVV